MNNSVIDPAFILNIREGGWSKEGREKQAITKRKQALILVRVANSNAALSTRSYLDRARSLCAQDESEYIELSEQEREAKMKELLADKSLGDIKEAIYNTSTLQEWLELPYLYRTIFPTIANSHLKVVMDKAAAISNKSLFDMVRMETGY